MTDYKNGKVYCVSTLQEVEVIERARQKGKIGILILRGAIQTRLAVVNLCIAIVRCLWFSPFSSSISKKPSIVINAHGTLGDHVVLLPALRVLRETFPDSMITLITYCGNFPIDVILAGAQLVDAVVPLPEHPLVRKGWKFSYASKRLEGIQCNLFINLSPFGNRGVQGFFFRDIIFSRKLGARSTCGFKLNFVARATAYSHVQHYFVSNEPRRCASVLKEIGLAITNMQDCLPHDERARAEVQDILHNRRRENQPLILLNPGAKLAYQCWPAVRFGELAQWLSRTFNACIVVNGTESEYPVVEEVVKTSGGTAINLAGAVNLQELIELVRMSTLCVSNNTGTMHVAAAVGTPVVAIFGTRWTPTHWFPLSSRVRVVFSFSSSSYVYADDNEPDDTLSHIRVVDMQQAIMDFVAQERLFDKLIERP